MSDTAPPLVPTPPVPPSDKAAYWRQAVADHSASGLSVREFCRSRGLHEKRFFTWRRSLGLSPADPPVAATGFIPVRVVPDTTAEMSLPGGITLRVPVAADPSAVARLVAALAGGGR
jgi:hypothetical protein